MKYALLIGAGSFFGGISRYYLGKAVQQQFLQSYPYGTLTVNILGCLLIGLLLGIAERYPFFNLEWRLILMVGFCGSFTTFSTFAGENIALIRDGQYYAFFLYTFISILLGLTAVLLGKSVINTI